jgi:nucleoside 2-deoxyribosyltransferase
MTTTIDGLQRTTDLRPLDRAHWLLRYLVRESGHLGHELKGFTVGDTRGGDNYVYFGTKVGPKAAGLFAWSGSIEADEVMFLLEMLAESSSIRLGSQRPIPEITVLAKGYEQVSLSASNAQFDQAFVAMWFDDSMLGAYEIGIEGAVREAGYRPLRIDRKEHVNKIDDEIIAEIRRSHFLVADFTSNPGNPRGGVYFEAGYALALGKPVIWTCRQDLIEHVHFDTRQFNHIVWNDPEELAKRLKHRIGAVLGQGPLKKG